MKGKQRCVSCGSFITAQHDSPVVPPDATCFYIAVRLTNAQLRDPDFVAKQIDAATMRCCKRIERRMAEVRS